MRSWPTSDGAFAPTRSENTRRSVDSKWPHQDVFYNTTCTAVHGLDWYWWYVVEL